MQPATQHIQQPEPHNLLRFWLCVVVGVALWFCPAPAGLSLEGWHVFAVFAATILSFLLRPLPMGVCVLIGLLVLGGTGALVPEIEVTRPNGAVFDVDGVVDTFVDQHFERHPLGERIKTSFAAMLSGYGDTTVWLVVAAFLISGGMVHSGLGRRMALTMIARLGRSTLGLGYAIAAAELVLAPFIPSNTARGGGLMMPIVDSISQALGSDPDHRPQRAGEYLVLCGAHLNLVTAAMFLTGMAANPLVASAALDFLDVEFTWGKWLAGSIVPGLASLLILPLLLYRLAPPSMDDAQAARDEVRRQLHNLGPWTPQQVTMAVVSLAMVVLWASTPLQQQWFDGKLPTAFVALAGVVTLVVARVLPYQQITGNAAAWDTLLWLGGLISMADALRETKFVDWFATGVQNGIGTTTGIAAAVLLAVAYFYSMYAFSMLTGHILAFVGVLFAVAAAVGAPPLATVALFAYFSNLCGATTNYSTGPVVIYFGLGYVTTGRWFWIGFLVSLSHLIVWLGLGLPWWKLLGWW